MLRRSYVCVLILVIIMAVPSFVFAMGGPPEEEETASPPPPAPAVEQAAPVVAPPVPAPKKAETTLIEIQAVTPEGYEKARAELRVLDEDMAKIESYLWNLDSKIIAVRKTKNSKRLLELKEKERETLDRARILTNKIAKLKEKYPGIEGYKPAKAVKVKQAEVTVPVQEAKPAAAAGQVVYHYVVMGDTLISISRKYFGSPSYFREIAAMNGMSDPSELKQGMILKIDLGIKGTVPQPQAPAPTPTL